MCRGTTPASHCREINSHMVFITCQSSFCYSYQLQLGDIPVPVVPRNRISDLLSSGLLLLRLNGRCSTKSKCIDQNEVHLFDNETRHSRVKFARDKVGCLLNVGLFRVGLHGRRSLVSKRLSALFDKRCQHSSLAKRCLAAMKSTKEQNLRRQTLCLC